MKYGTVIYHYTGIQILSDDLFKRELTCTFDGTQADKERLF